MYPLMKTIFSIKIAQPIRENHSFYGVYWVIFNSVKIILRRLNEFIIINQLSLM